MRVRQKVNDMQFQQPSQLKQYIDYTKSLFLKKKDLHRYVKQIKEHSLVTIELKFLLCILN